MPNTVLIGAQWGDEGKGKIIDVLTRESDWVVRYQGGHNAGHTVEVGDQKYILHLIPSGILHPDKRCVIGNGLVVSPTALLEEIGMLKKRGIDPTGRLFVSDRAHVVLPYHPKLDASSESRLAKGSQIGTTQRGIGPAYTDKASRYGLRMCDLTEPDLEHQLRRRIQEKNAALEAMGAAPLEESLVIATVLEEARQLKPYIADTVKILAEVGKRGERILFEGAQGTMLDVDFGTYPFVTSSSATAGGACTGSGVGPSRIDEVVGVIKAYTTRVGEGPFPTELNNATGEQLRKTGGEFGATTGRPRRCGWFDAVVARYTAMVNGVTSWAITKLDVLDDFDTIKICVGYELDGKRIDHVPASVNALARCQPIYEDFTGWKASTREATCFGELPARTQAYVRHLASLTGVRVGMLSVGPRRASTMKVDITP